MSCPRFFQQPIRYLRWTSLEKPAIFYAIVFGSLGPASFLVAPPLRKLFNDQAEAERIPLTYPITSGERSPPHGFEDD